MTLHSKIFLGLLAGIAIGLLARVPGATWLMQAVIFGEPFGTAFIRLITMVVVPLVIASLFVGVAGLGDIRRLSRIGGRTLIYFVVTTFLAASIGMIVAVLAGIGTHVDFVPGAGGGNAGPDQLLPALSQTFLNMVPQNPFAAAAQADLLPLVVAVCIFGAAATVTSGARRQAVVSFFEGVNDLCTVVIGWVMLLAPIGVMLLTAVTFARSGVQMLQGLLAFAVAVVVALIVHTGVLLFLLRTRAGMTPSVFFRGVADPLLLAFSTASSNAALPVSMEAARSRLQSRPEVVSFVLPLGASMNKNGAAVYKACTAVFVAGIYGVHLGPIGMITIVVASVVAAFAGTGVPGSSLVTTVIVLNAIGLGSTAQAAVALVAGIDRPLDMCRTAVNTIGNLIGTVLVSRSTGTSS